MANARSILILIVVIVAGVIAVWSSSSSSSSSSSPDVPAHLGRNHPHHRRQQQQQQAAALPPSSSPSVSALQGYIAPMLECAELLQRGRMWDGEQRKCVPIPGWAPPLRSFELDPEELSCKKDDAATPKRWWSSGAFQTGDATSAGTSEFVFRSSWLFHKYRFFENETVVPDGDESAKKWKRGTKRRLYYDSVSKASDFQFRSFHDTSAQNIFRIDNFCIHPLGGLHAIVTNPNQQVNSASHGGKDETYNFYHNSPAMQLYLQRVKKVAVSSPAAEVVPVTDRGAVLVYLSPLSRGNLWHSLHQYLNIIGTLKLRPFGGDAESPAPVIIFVFDHYPGESFGGRAKRQQQQQQHEQQAKAERFRFAFGYLFRLLGEDVPWAVVTNSGAAASEEILRPLHERTQHVFPPPLHATLADISQKEDTSAVFETLADEFKCFRRGVVVQNCYLCSVEQEKGGGAIMTKSRTDEEYSFGMFDLLTPARRQLLFDYRQAMEACLPFSSPAITTTTTTSNKPRVFFDLRTQTRTIVDFGLVAASLRRDLVGGGIVSALDYREAGHGSRAQYLDEARGADIFVGIHGSGFTSVPLLGPSSSSGGGNSNNHNKRRRIVVIEVTSSLHFCAFPSNYNEDAPPPHLGSRCWFGSYTDALESQPGLAVDHYLVQVDADWRLRPGESMKPPQRESPLFVPRSLLDEVIRDAAAAVAEGVASASSSSAATVVVEQRPGRLRTYRVTLQDHYALSYVLELLNLFFAVEAAPSSIVFDVDAGNDMKVSGSRRKKKQQEIAPSSSSAGPGGAFVGASRRLRRVARNEELVITCDLFDAADKEDYSTVLPSTLLETGDNNDNATVGPESSESCPPHILDGWKGFTRHYLARELRRLRFRKRTPRKIKTLVRWRFRTKICVRLGGEVTCMSVFRVLDDFLS